MKTILIACAVTFATIAVSTSAMASAVPDLDAVSVVNAKNVGVIQVADKKDKHKRKASKIGYVPSPRLVAGPKHKRIKSSVEKAGKPTPTFGTAKKNPDVGVIERKAPHYKRKSPRQCRKGQTAGCKNK